MHKDVVMSESLLFMVEERVRLLLAEVEVMRQEIRFLRTENHQLKTAHSDHTHKLLHLIAQLEALGKETV